MLLFVTHLFIPGCFHGSHCFKKLHGTALDRSDNQAHKLNTVFVGLFFINSLRRYFPFDSPFRLPFCIFGLVYIYFSVLNI